MNELCDNDQVILPAEIERLIREKIPDARVTVKDMTGTGDHFEIQVISNDFAGKSLIEQHQMVFGALEKEMDKRIHAVQLKTRLPR